MADGPIRRKGNIVAYLEELTTTVKGEPHQELLTSFLGDIVDLYSILCCHFARAMAEVDGMAEDEGLKESIRRYAIEIGDITQRVYSKEMEAPIEDMKRFLDGLLHLYDEGRTRVKMGDLFEIKNEARNRLNERNSESNTN